MFHNIFDKLRKKKKSKKKPIKIIVDIHEKDSLIIAELKSNKEIELEIKSLKIGDYLIGETIIERKTTGDFIHSMLSKRLIEQLNQMKQYKQKLLIIEGDILDLYRKDTKINPNAIRGFILSILTNQKADIIFTKDDKDSADYLITLAKQQLKPKTLSSLHSRIPKTKGEQKKYILEAFPNIGPKTSERLIKRFKTLNNIFNASEEDLKDILKNRKGEFKNLLDS